MKTRKSSKLLCIVLISSVGLLTTCQEKAPVPSTLPSAVDQTVYPYIALGAAVGVVVGVVKNGQKSVYSYGEKALGTRDSPTAQTLFEIGSITKTFTALALADMHLRGLVQLDDPVEKYLPPNVKMPSWNGQPITLRQLANHTSGLPRQPTNMDEDAYNPYQGYTQEKLYEFLASYTLPRKPGSQYEYSNVGYGLLGHVLSVRNQSDFQSLITTGILVPLGMQHTRVTPPESREGNRAQGHYGDQKVESWAKYMQNVTQGTGALESTAEDMLVYLEVCMGIMNSPLGEAMALTQQSTFPLSDKYHDGIGLGWYLVRSEGEEITWKNGGNGGFTAFIGFSKTTDTGVVVLINSSLNPDPFQTQIGFQLLKQLKNL